MRQTKLEKNYKILPIISLIILVICFIFRYSYISFMWFDRPLKLAVFVCTSLGIIGSLLAMIDGVNKYFNNKVVWFLIFNLIFVFTFPLLNVGEQFSKKVSNPYADLVPETDHKTSHRKDAAFILEGELYEWPLSFADFTNNGYEYRDLADNKVSISKAGKSNKPKPTYFTDGERNSAGIESYNLVLNLDGKGDIENQNVESLEIKSLENNWDFEIQGFTLIESTYKLEEKYGDKLSENPDNKNKTIKEYYLTTDDGYLISFGSFRGKIQTVKIERDQN